jgi:hypothetical protein
MKAEAQSEQEQEQEQENALPSAADNDYSLPCAS